MASYFSQKTGQFYGPVKATVILWPITMSIQWNNELERRWNQVTLMKVLSRNCRVSSKSQGKSRKAVELFPSISKLFQHLHTVSVWLSVTLNVVSYQANLSQLLNAFKKRLRNLLIFTGQSSSWNEKFGQHTCNFYRWKSTQLPLRADLMIWSLGKHCTRKRSKGGVWRSDRLSPQRCHSWHEFLSSEVTSHQNNDFDSNESKS